MAQPIWDALWHLTYRGSHRSVRDDGPGPGCSCGCTWWSCSRGECDEVDESPESGPEIRRRAADPWMRLGPDSRPGRSRSSPSLHCRSSSSKSPPPLPSPVVAESWNRNPQSPAEWVDSGLVKAARMASRLFQVTTNRLIILQPLSDTNYYMPTVDSHYIRPARSILRSPCHWRKWTRNRRTEFLRTQTPPGSTSVSPAAAAVVFPLGLGPGAPGRRELVL